VGLVDLYRKLAREVAPVRGASVREGASPRAEAGD
jgi:hypothetical protein